MQTDFAPGPYYVGGYMYNKVTHLFTNAHLTSAITVPSPTFKLLGPTSGTYAAGQNITVNWTAADASLNGVVSLCLDADTTLWNGNEKWIEVDKLAATLDNNEPTPPPVPHDYNGSYTFDTTGIAPGTYYIGGYMYDKVTHMFTNSHLMQSITISDNSSAASIGASIAGDLTTKKKESAAIDSVMQNQGAWLAADAGDSI